MPLPTFGFSLFLVGPSFLSGFGWLFPYLGWFFGCYFWAWWVLLFPSTLYLNVLSGYYLMADVDLFTLEFVLGLLVVFVSSWGLGLFFLPLWLAAAGWVVLPGYIFLSDWVITIYFLVIFRGFLLVITLPIFLYVGIASLLDWLFPYRSCLMYFFVNWLGGLMGWLVWLVVLASLVGFPFGFLSELFLAGSVALLVVFLCFGLGLMVVGCYNFPTAIILSLMEVWRLHFHFLGLLFSLDWWLLLVFVLCSNLVWNCWFFGASCSLLFWFWDVTFWLFGDSGGFVSYPWWLFFLSEYLATILSFLLWWFCWSYFLSGLVAFSQLGDL